MLEHLTLIRGPRGQARYVPVPDPPVRPDHAATVGLWVVHAPGWSPAWCHFTMGVVHLRDLPGVPPATRQYPAAAYEFMVGALDPAQPIHFAEPNALAFHWLRPLNVVEQFHGVDDPQAGALLRMLVEDAVQGRVVLEPQGIVGARDHWRARLRAGGAVLPCRRF